MVGERKNKNDKWLPKRVYRGKSSYEYRPAKGICIRLIKRPTNGIESEQVKAAVWEAYRRETTVKQYLVVDLISDFHKSPQFKSKSVRTQQDYLRYSVKVARVFGQMLPEAVKPLHIRKFMDKIGEQHPVTANRHHSYLSVLFAWGLERGLCETNPAKSVSKFKEESRDRYVEQWEFDLVYNVALDSSYPYLAHMMMVAYLCRMRPFEVRALREDHIIEEGVFVERGKGSANEITRWSPKLKKAVEEARKLHPDSPVVMSRPLFHGKNGAPIPKSAFQTAWTRVMTKALNKGLKERFTFHDLKARGITNHKSKHGGHKSKKMARVYDRKPGMIDATE